MILLIGQVGRDMMDREAFQEIDYRQMFAPVAKWAAQIDVTARIPEYMARAFQVATSGRPGPVVLALPEDMLTEVAVAEDARRYVPVQAEPAADKIEQMRALLGGAERPLLLVGGSGWTDKGCDDIKRFAEANGLPVATSFRRQDSFDNYSPCFAGDLGTSGPKALIQRFKDADLLLVIGARLGELTTQGYTVMNTPAPRQRLIHVHPDADEIGRVFSADLAIASSSSAFAAALAGKTWFAAGHWKDWREHTHRDYLAAIAPPSYDGPLDLERAMVALRDLMPEDAIVTLDAGNHTGWPQRFLRYARPGRQIGSTNGSMGYSVPAAVAASLVCPDRMVVGCVGDGGFMMSGLELATAAQHGGKPIILLFDNRMYGTIRMHQEREHPERVIGTDLVNPDFVAMAKAMGAHAEMVTETKDFAAAFQRASTSGRPALIVLQADPELISTSLTITGLREAATAK
jgi:acetolactate synthase-1/2/3 large subunit